MLYFCIYKSTLTLQAVSATLVTYLNAHCLMKPKITFQNIKLHLYQSSPVLNRVLQQTLIKCRSLSSQVSPEYHCSVSSMRD